MSQEKILDRLQRVQNSLARTVCWAKWSDSATEHRQTLHWLPIRQRIEYKIAVMTFNARIDRGPRYVSELFGTNFRPGFHVLRVRLNCTNSARHLTSVRSLFRVLHHVHVYGTVCSPNVTTA